MESYIAQIIIGVLAAIILGWMGWLSLLALRNQKSIIKNQGNVTKLELQIAHLLQIHTDCKTERIIEISKLYDRVEEHNKENAIGHNNICKALGKVEGKLDTLISNG